MLELKFDHAVPELIEEPDAPTLSAIQEGLAQLNAGLGVPMDDLRRELAARCSR